jgi:O-antigen ligase
MLSKIELGQFWALPADVAPKWRKLYFFAGFVLMVYACTKIVCPSIAKFAETLVWLCGIPLCVINPYLKRSCWRWLALFCIVVQVLSWFSAWLTHPEWASALPTIDRMGKLFFFIPIALIMAGNFRNVIVSWYLFALGLFVFILISPEYWPSLADLAHGERVDFGIWNAQHTAMYFGVLTLLLLVFIKRWILNPSQIFPLSRVFLFFALVFSIFALYVTQTRAILLGAVLSLFCIAVHFIFGKIAKGLKRSHLLMGSIGVIFVVTLFGYGITSIVAKRMSDEAETVHLIMDGHLNSLPYTSIGIRIHTWIEAAHHIEERPILGWGDKARSLVIKKSKILPDDIRDNFGHLHNYYIETQLSYGLLGSVFLILFFAYVIREIYVSWKKDIISHDVGILSLCFIVYWLFINNFESYMSFNTGVFVLGLILGGLMTQRMFYKET